MSGPTREGTKGHLDLVLLGVLASGPGHGYAIITTLKQRSDGALDLPEGSVYPALHKLEDMGLVASDWASRRRAPPPGVPPDLRGEGRLELGASRMVEALYCHQRRPGCRAAPTSDVMKDGPIDDYLDKLFVELRQSSPRGARSMLNEAEAHLRDSADEAAVPARARKRLKLKPFVCLAKRAWWPLPTGHGVGGGWRRRLRIGLVLGGLGCRRGRGERPGRRGDAARGRLQPVLGWALDHVGG